METAASKKYNHGCFFLFQATLPQHKFHFIFGISEAASFSVYITYNCQFYMNAVIVITQTEKNNAQKIPKKIVRMKRKFRIRKIFRNS